MATHWNTVVNAEQERPDVDAFIRDITEVCRKHGLTLSHEDGHGAFEVERYDQHTIEWLNNAHVNF